MSDHGRRRRIHLSPQPGRVSGNGSFRIAGRLAVALRGVNSGSPLVRPAETSLAETKARETLPLSLPIGAHTAASPGAGVTEIVRGSSYAAFCILTYPPPILHFDFWPPRFSRTSVRVPTSSTLESVTF